MKKWTFGILLLLTTFSLILYPKQMPKNKPIWTFEKTTNLTLEQIEEILFNIQSGYYKSGSLSFILKGKTSCEVKKEGDQFVISFEDGHKEHITINMANHKLTNQGEWWYQGVYSFQPISEKTSIRFDIYNNADNYRWIASLMIIPEKNKHKTGFEKFIVDLENEVKE